MKISDTELNKIITKSYQFFDVIEIGMINVDHLKTLLKYILYNDEEYKRIIMKMYYDYNLIEYFKIWKKYIDEILLNSKSAMMSLLMTSSSLFKIVRYLVSTNNPSFVLINQLLYSKIILCYCNKKDWIKNIDFFYKNSTCVDLLKIINEGYISFEIFDTDLKMDMDKNILFVHTYF